MRKHLFLLAMVALTLDGCKKNEPIIDPAAQYLGDYQCGCDERHVDYSQRFAVGEGSRSRIFQARIAKRSDNILELLDLTDNAEKPVEFTIIDNRFIVRMYSQSAPSSETYSTTTLGDGKVEGNKLYYTTNQIIELESTVNPPKRLFMTVASTCTCFKK